jgi:hypothetical protein
MLEMAQRGMTLDARSHLGPTKVETKTAPIPLRDQANLIVALADVIREARGAGPWSTDNLPGKDQERARFALTIVDGWLTGTAGAAPLRELLDELQTLLRTARGALTGLTGFTALTGSAVAEARADIEQAIGRLDDWNRMATKLKGGEG